MGCSQRKVQMNSLPDDTEFGKILSGKRLTKFIYEDDTCVAFEDINPIAPVHFLVIPRKPIPQLRAAAEEDEPLLGHLMIVAKQLAMKKGLKDGFRIVVNDGPNGRQTVYHLHLHVLGGRRLCWPFA